MWTYAFLSLGHRLRCGIVRLCANPALHWLRAANLSQAGHTILHSQKHPMRAPFSSHPGQHWLLSTLSLEVLLGGMTWYRSLDLAFPWCLRASLHVEMQTCLSYVCEAVLTGVHSTIPAECQALHWLQPRKRKVLQRWSCAFIVPPCPAA